MDNKMDKEYEELMEKRLRKAMTKIFKQMIHDMENAPHLILEAEEQAEENQQTIDEITSWLFRRGTENGN